ncbi:MAG: hypothetical protein U9Q68_08555 [Euryarchaeota archaeon]|nr:hypothetical protein [Euryarchaeota archaeon]
MGKNILEKLFAEYNQNIDRILKKCGGKDGIDEIVWGVSVSVMYGGSKSDSKQ